jgi:hypothetical protein
MRRRNRRKAPPAEPIGKRGTLKGKLQKTFKASYICGHSYSKDTLKGNFLNSMHIHTLYYKKLQYDLLA